MSIENSASPFNYYSRYEGGHRADYMRFVENKYGASRVSLIGVFLSKKPVLFLMAEERPIFVVFSMILRRLLGRRTIALLFRLRPLINGKGLVSSVKRMILFAVKRSDKYGFISIIPNHIYPEVLTVCRYSIFDFQFWDCLDRDVATSARNENGIAILGRQDVEKGFHYVSSFLSEFKSIDTIDIYGKISAECEYCLADIKEIIPDADVQNRFVADEEIFEAYTRNKYVWCCYSPSYDQSSGILGRAIQFGNIPVVRKSSLSEAYCRILANEYVAVNVLDDFVVSYEFCSGSRGNDGLVGIDVDFLRIVEGV